MFVCVPIIKKMLENTVLLCKFINDDFRLPLINIQIAGKTVVACCDTGSTRSLLSTEIFDKIFPQANYQLLKPVQFNIQAVNDTHLNVYGSKVINITINEQQFSQNMFVFQHSQNTIILGWDFFCRHFLICAPNFGILSLPQKFQTKVTEKCWTSFHKQVKVFECRASADAAVLPLKSQFIEITLNGNVPEYMAKGLIGKTLCCHSEFIEPHQNLGKLAVFFNIIIWQPSNIIRIMYTNHTDEIRYIKKGEVVAHAEFMQQWSGDESHIHLEE